MSYTPQTSPVGLFNFNSANYPATKKAIANLRLGIQFNAGMLGDSTTVGYNGTLANELANSWASQIPSVLNTSGVRAGWQNWLSNHFCSNASTTLSNIDARITEPPSGWDPFAVQACGGSQYWINTTNTNPMTFAPTVPTNTCDFYFIDGDVNYGTVKFKTGPIGIVDVATVNGVAGSTWVPALTQTIKKITVSTNTAASMNVWTAAKLVANGQPVIFLGCNAYDSANPEISFLNMSGHGIETGAFTQTGAYYNSLPVISTTATSALAGLPLYIINLGLNDMFDNNLANTQANLDTMVSALKTAGSDVLLIIPVAVSTSVTNASSANQALLRSYVVNVATKYNCAYIDLPGLTPYASANYPDGVHPYTFYYTQIASQIAQFFGIISYGLGVVPNVLLNSQPTFSKTLNAIGDSITAGQGTTGNLDYVSRIATARNWTKANLAVGGSTCESWVSNQIGSKPIVTGDVTVTMAGFNNARYNGSDVAKLAQFRNVLKGTIGYCAVPDANKIYSQTLFGFTNTAQATFSGTWSTSTTWIGVQSNSKCGGYSNVSGSYMETTVTGSVVHVMLGGNSAIAGSAARITVDGVESGYGTILPTPAYASPDGQAVWQPYLVTIRGLSSGPHVVRVTITANVATLVAYIAGYDPNTYNLPVVYVGNTLNMSAAGYAVSPANATDAIMSTYRSTVFDVTQELRQMGLLVVYTDLNGSYNPNSITLDADNVHPNNIAHGAFAQRMLIGINQAPFIKGPVSSSY